MACQDGKQPKWIGNIVWNNLLEKWNKPMYQSKCDKTKKNRLSEKGGSLHIRRSISVHEHAIRTV